MLLRKKLEIHKINLTYQHKRNGPIPLLPGPLLRRGVSQGRRPLRVNHLSDDQTGGDQHDGRGQEQHADGVSDQGVVSDVAGVGAQFGGVDSQNGVVVGDDGAVG